MDKCSSFSTSKMYHILILDYFSKIKALQLEFQF